ncbi:MAG: 30S ribosomal protein S18 [Candidatus Pacebacteria bacterium]|nr:30S ribosomal protein S18 [Candidatus Paceibacterota bacterium]
MSKDYFIKNKIKHIDYKDLEILKKFINPHGRIIASKHNGLAAKNQKKVTRAIKNARFLALLPYINF